MQAADFSCWRCGQPLDGMLLPVSRREECAQCRAEIHVCRMCVHFRQHRQNWCAEDRAEPPQASDHANFCDYFAPNGQAWTGPQNAAGARAQEQLDALFDGDEGSQNPADAADALNKLFGDD